MANDSATCLAVEIEGEKPVLQSPYIDVRKPQPQRGPTSGTDQPTRAAVPRERLQGLALFLPTVPAPR